MSYALDLPTFVARWRANTQTERATAQSHFIDLCHLLGRPAPNEADPAGSWYAFEKGAKKIAGGDGWADVWMRGHFAWEYKGKHKNLAKAYQQLQQYREDLENPPLLVVCDFDRFEVHTNFTGTVKQVFAFTLADLAGTAATPTCALPPLEVLRAVFTQPEALRPQRTTAEVTEQAAAEFARLADSLRDRGHAPETAARFLMRLLFCLFAEDIGLLPGELLTKLVGSTVARPDDFGARLRALFAAMATGGFFGADDIPHFNGGLFADDRALPLTTGDLAVLARAARLNWASVEPAIFGTLFERSLDPAKRSELGAHYTSRADILLIVEPVLMVPLRRRWSAVREQALALRDRLAALEGKADATSRGGRTRLQGELERLLIGFTGEIAAVRVLDPACGSGNFLYVALKALLDLWKEVSLFAAASGVSGLLPYNVGPAQLHGIEVNVYAHELASIVVWIGYIEWLHDNGYGIPDAPILQSLHNIHRMDALICRDAAGTLVEPPWPEAEVIVGNPPFLGGKRLRTVLGDGVVDDLFTLYAGRVPREGDLVCYWFERARALVQAGSVRRAGLLATQGIRGGANRKVLERIKETGGIFMAWGDRPWVLDGAAVRVSSVGFDDGTEATRTLDGLPVAAINANLTGALDLTRAVRLPENRGISYMGDTKGGSFDIDGRAARLMLAAPANPNGRPNSDVVRPWVNGLDLTRRPRDMWIVDFGVDMGLEDAALYELPFAHVERHVRPERASNKRATYQARWWIHVEPRPALRRSLAPLSRFIATPNLTKHRLFGWLTHPTLPDHQLIVFAREDDYFFGVLHSRVHETWALGLGTALEDRPRYTPTSTFETFPFPRVPSFERPDDPLVAAVVEAARNLVARRDAWINPAGASEAELKKRTLTALYNQRPTWLALAHERLDHAVLAAYGWPHDLADEQILERLLRLNLERASNDSIPPDTVEHSDSLKVEHSDSLKEEESRQGLGDIASGAAG